MSIRRFNTGLALGLAVLGASVLAPAVLSAQASAAGPGTVPRMPDGRPDLQGDWTNATLTPLQRPAGQELILTPEQVAEAEGGRVDYLVDLAQPSDPDRVAPPVGGDGSTGAKGGVGGYNHAVWFQAGDLVARVNGEPRSSLLTQPPGGRRPTLLPQARERIAAGREASSGFGQYDNPENRPLAERCIISFGSSAGPPMAPNYAYNNTYTIVQTPDHIMILTEMVHDIRIIRFGERQAMPDHMRPYMGDSWGHWEGDVLVVETTNIHPGQAFLGVAATPDLKVIERFTVVDERTIHYEFTIEDPSTYAEPWGGEIPFTRMRPGELVYEYACHEANYALSNILSGARAQERGNR